MIDRTPYTPGMREVLKLSKLEAGRPGHETIGPEHYLLAIIRKADGLAVESLAALGVDLGELKLEIERGVAPGEAPTAGIVSPNPEAKRALESARAVAAGMMHGWVGTEHLLLGILTETGTIAARCLFKFGVDLKKAREAVIRVIEGGAPSAPAAAAPMAAGTNADSMSPEDIRDFLRRLDGGAPAGPEEIHIIRLPSHSLPDLLKRDLMSLVRSGALDAEAARRMEEADLAVSLSLGLDARMANTLFNLGGLAEHGGDFAAAADHWTRALALVSLLGRDEDAARISALLKCLPDRERG